MSLKQAANRRSCSRHFHVPAASLAFLLRPLQRCEPDLYQSPRRLRTRWYVRLLTAPAIDRIAQGSGQTQFEPRWLAGVSIRH